MLAARVCDRGTQASQTLPWYRFTHVLNFHLMPAICYQKKEEKTVKSTMSQVAVLNLPESQELFRSSYGGWEGLSAREDRSDNPLVDSTPYCER